MAAHLPTATAPRRHARGARRGAAHSIDSWRRILLGGGAPPRIRCHRPVARTMGEIGWVVCEEVLPGGSLAATNVFVREQNAWRIVHHHASPVPAAGTEPEGLPN